MSDISKALGGYTETPWGWVDDSYVDGKPVQTYGAVRKFNVDGTAIVLAARWTFYSTEYDTPYSGTVVPNQEFSIGIRSSKFEQVAVDYTVTSPDLVSFLSFEKAGFSQGSYDYRVLIAEGIEAAIMDVLQQLGMIDELATKEREWQEKIDAHEAERKAFAEKVLGSTPSFKPERKVNKHLNVWWAKEESACSSIEERDALRLKYLQVSEDIENGVFTMHEVRNMLRDGWTIQDILDLVDDDEVEDSQEPQNDEVVQEPTSYSLDDLVNKFNKK